MSKASINVSTSNPRQSAKRSISVKPRPDEETKQGSGASKISRVRHKPSATQSKKKLNRQPHDRSRTQLTWQHRIQNWYSHHINPQVVHLKSAMAIEAARGLNLQQKHLRTLRNKFDSIDIDGSGSIELKEFILLLGEDPTSPFINNLMKMIDIDNSNTIEFEEYVRILATYCMYTKDEILRFCFECFDEDRSGAISESEYKELIRQVNAGKPMFPENFKKVLELFDENRDGVIDYREFCAMEVKFPMILYPAFRLQDAMQKTSLGEMEWVRIQERYRKRLFTEEYQSSHGGHMPPPTPGERLSRLFCCCLARPPEHAAIKLGAELEQRHRLTTTGTADALRPTSAVGGGSPTKAGGEGIKAMGSKEGSAMKLRKASNPSKTRKPKT